jgi:hypothetical protein
VFICGSTQKYLQKHSFVTFDNRYVFRREMSRKTHSKPENGAGRKFRPMLLDRPGVKNIHGNFTRWSPLSGVASILIQVEATFKVDFPACAKFLKG